MQFLKWLALKIPLVHLVIGEQCAQLHLHKLLHYKVQYTSCKFCQETREHFVKQCSMLCFSADPVITYIPVWQDVYSYCWTT